MDKKRKTVLIAVAAMLLVVAIFLLPRRSQPLGELIPAPETARVDGLFYISTIVPTPDGYGTFDTRSEERRVGKECRSRWSPYH